MPLASLQCTPVSKVSFFKKNIFSMVEILPVIIGTYGSYGTVHFFRILTHGCFEFVHSVCHEKGN
jgi:hypothetical protein